MWTCFSYIQQKWYNYIHPSSMTICWQPYNWSFQKATSYRNRYSQVEFQDGLLVSTKKQWGIQDDVVLLYVLDFFSALKSWISSRTHPKGMSNWVGFSHFFVASGIIFVAPRPPWNRQKKTKLSIQLKGKGRRLSDECNMIFFKGKRGGGG